ncbi:MAG: hypothetical protein A3K06_00495 [Candidatus Doudnabacteria bacterium RIFCSPHIGHO2_01_52_17]|uniref:Inositol-1-monophosphatase n=1 Tax=Candidatus Doudnabacteria bacterium RIFCSPHIGHO2_01_52_17 TaxID=1817820 RepID=A0A1F5NEJ1_9BACT|nr:MAG: Inositol-phosphate phosphatase [Parcubacteria group bacterium GW2011_GWA2_52_8]OGE76089.1 MAG: hypothetical protein A3K06_00495 [Candidatus Doudnabacteria bacterium RIFCSPHIGHO2_01_52_17]
MEKHLKIALRAARAANKILRAGFATNFKTKAKPGEIVANSFTKYDLLAQKAILKILNSAFPSHSYLAEEGVNLVKQSDYQWIVDPLDGTTNFSRGLPYFSSSIALAHKGKVVLGVVALPLQNEFYWAVAKHGTFMNGRRVRVSKVSNLKAAAVDVSTIRSSRETMKKFAETLDRLASVPTIIRVNGSVATDLARVAGGKEDASIFHNMNAWDIAAGTLLVTEAGGKITVRDPKNPQTQVVASNRAIHGALLKLLK